MRLAEYNTDFDITQGGAVAAVGMEPQWHQAEHRSDLCRREMGQSIPSSKTEIPTTGPTGALPIGALLWYNMRHWEKALCDWRSVMASKAAFSEKEWELVKDAPEWVRAALTSADKQAALVTQL